MPWRWSAYDNAMRWPRKSLLGVNMSCLGFAETVNRVTNAILARDKLAISPSPVYTIMQGFERPEVRAALNANLVTPDGMPVVWALRLLGVKAERVYGPDLMAAICQQSIEKGWRHYFYGGADGVPDLLAAALAERYKGLRVVGAESPPFRALDAVEQREMVERLNGSEADIVWVGLGSPKQDIWLATNREALSAPVLIAVGAAFDFYAGRVQQAPRWMQRNGLEWVFRLFQEPGRLWRRYLIYNPWFVWEVFLQVTGLRQYPTP